VTAGYKWRPLVRSFVNHTPRAVIEATAQRYGLSLEDAKRRLDEEDVSTEVWVNDLYQIERRVLDAERKLVHLNIRRRDGAPCIRDWRHFQQIKNELLGPECEAVELYPAESRKVDTSNKYHLYGVADPSFRFPLGWQEREVIEDEDRSAPGLRQRGRSL
jgi:hypothetical protein